MNLHLILYKDQVLLFSPLSICSRLSFYKYSIACECWLSFDPIVILESELECRFDGLHPAASAVFPVASSVRRQVLLIVIALFILSFPSLGPSADLLIVSIVFTVTITVLLVFNDAIDVNGLGLVVHA